MTRLVPCLLAVTAGGFLCLSTPAQQTEQKAIPPRAAEKGLTPPQDTELPGIAQSPPDSGFSDSFSPPMDRQVKKRLEAAEEDYIKNKAWGEAAQLLQRVLDGKEDVFVKVQREEVGKPGRAPLVSARAEANRLLGTMPRDGLEFYELQYGAQARGMLEKAKLAADPQLLGEVAQRFFHTVAGAEATDLQGAYHLDRGEPQMAAGCYKRLLAREGNIQITPFTLLKAALAFRRVGDPEHALAAEGAWKKLADKGREGVRIGDRTYGLDVLRKEFESSSSGDLGNLYEWTLFRGNAARTARAKGSAPFLESKWRVSSISELGNPNRGHEARKWVQQAQRNSTYRSDTMLPAFFPIAAAGKVIYRSYWGIHALDIKTGELAWESGLTASLEMLLRDPNKQQPVTEWFTLYHQGSNQNIIFENSTVGTLSTDNTRVYAVDDLGVPPHPGSQQMQPWGWGGGATLSGPMMELAQRSRLVANDLESGKIVWEHGDPAHDTSELAGSYFLGPPLPLGGRLYALTEKNLELRLVCLEATKGEIVWTQTLGTVRDRLMLDVSRRVQAVHLAYGEGMLICPTNAGAVICIDIFTRSLVWAYPYREKSKAPEGQEAGRIIRGRGIPQAVWNSEMSGMKVVADWKMTAPIISDGKVIFTAPDAPGVYCLNLSDGRFIWQADRKDDLYLAGVHQNKVVLVGKNSTRAISATDGKTRQWELQTGPPSGLGVLSGSQYFLPLRKGEVCTIDIDLGQIVAHNPASKGEGPGNLLFHGGDMISQTETTLSAYPQVESKVAQIDARLEKNPRDAVALTERGELKLYKGDLAGAVADLREASAADPKSDVLPKTRAKLYTTLTELLQRDFSAAEPYLSEYKQLCKIVIPQGASEDERHKLEEEERQRQAGFLCLLGRGREKQGRLLEAFQAYLDFSALADARELVAVINEPSVKAQPSVWAQGRIASLVAKATPLERTPLEEEINRRWNGVKESRDLNQHRRFVEAFGSLFQVGRIARLLLAERLLEEKSYLEAEMHLLELRRLPDDTLLSAQATEALARLSTSKGVLEDAAYYYRQLGKKYAKVVIRDGKTGAAYVRELATDKRFIPYLEDDDLLLIEGSVRALEVPGGAPIQMMLPLEARGQPGPFLQRHRLMLRVQNVSNLHVFELKVFDRESGEERWSFSSPAGSVNYMSNMMNSIRFPYYAQGHLVVLYLGHRVYGLDLAGRKKLWERDLMNPERPLPQQPYVQQALSLDKEGGLYLPMPQGLQKLGMIGPVTPSYVCLVSYEGLVTLDPVSGKTLWIKSDIQPESTQLFGDEHNIYIVDVRRDGSIGATRVVRGRDGATVEAPDFGPIYQKKQRLIGGRILLTEIVPGEGKAVRLYDIVQGKDIWKRTTSAAALVLRAEDESLTGIVEPDGKTTIIDLRSQQEIFQAKIRPEHLEKIDDGILLGDAKQWFVLLSRPEEPNARVRGAWNNLSYMRSTPANGVMYAFDKASKKLSWYVAVSHQMLMLEHFADLPMVVFTAQYHRYSQKDPSSFTMVAATLTIDKQTGKRLYDQESSPTRGQYHALKLDRRGGVIDLISSTMKLRHAVGHASASEEQSAPATSTPDTRPSGRPNPQTGGLRNAPREAANVIVDPLNKR